jgi:hypothetical protein
VSTFVGPRTLLILYLFQNWPISTLTPEEAQDGAYLLFIVSSSQSSTNSSQHACMHGLPNRPLRYFLSFFFTSSPLLPISFSPIHTTAKPRILPIPPTSTRNPHGAPPSTWRSSPKQATARCITAIPRRTVMISLMRCACGHQGMEGGRVRKERLERNQAGAGVGGAEARACHA